MLLDIPEARVARVIISSDLDEIIMNLLRAVPAALILCTSIFSAVATEITSQTRTFSDGFQGELERVAAAHRGDVGIYCHHLEKNETYKVNADVAVPTASTIKVPVMCAALDLLVQGTGPYKSYYDTRKFDAASTATGSGIIQKFKDGTAVELKELIHLMITVSDNVGTNMIADWIGLEAVNKWLADRGFEQTRMFSTIGGTQIYDAEGRKTWGLGRTTPAEMGRLMEMIATGKAGTTSATDEMLRVLGHQYFDGGIAAGIPPMVYAGTKSGSLQRHRSDNGIIAAHTGTYILSVYTNNNEDTRWKSDNEGELLIRKVSRMVWKHFNPESDWEPAPGSDQF